MAYKYTNETELMVKDFCVDILENDKNDLFDLGRNTRIINYDDEAEANDYSRGIVDINYNTIPAYAWDSEFKPKNKKLAKLFEDLYADDNDMNLYTYVDCEFSVIENGVKLTVSMVITDPYGSFLVKDYKPTTTIINDDDDEVEIYDKVYNCIYGTTSQF